MDVVVRRRRVLLIAWLGLATLLPSSFVVGCGPKTPGPVVGESDRVPAGGSSRETKDAGGRDGAAALPADYRTSFTKLNRSRFVSSGHAHGRWDVDVYANEAAQKAIASRSRDVPVGAIVVQEHFEKTPSAAGNTGPVMVMEKRPKGFAPDHGDWRYAVVGSAGQLVKDGVVDSCAGCHDDAPMDGLFPIAALAGASAD